MYAALQLEKQALPPLNINESLSHFCYSKIMAEIFAAPHFLPQEAHLSRHVLLLFVPLTFGACGFIDYDLERSHFAAPSSKGRDIGLIYFHYADDKEPYTVHVRKVRGGYAMQAPLYDNSDGDHVQFSASRTKQRDYFIGIEGKFTF